MVLLGHQVLHKSLALRLSSRHDFFVTWRDLVQ